jgi:hypothetical protein
VSADKCGHHASARIFCIGSRERCDPLETESGFKTRVSAHIFDIGKMSRTFAEKSLLRLQLAISSIVTVCNNEFGQSNAV